MLENIRSRTDLTGREKEELIKNAYLIVGGGEDGNSVRETPRAVSEYGVKEINYDESTTVAGTVAMVEEYFGFGQNVLDKENAFGPA